MSSLNVKWIDAWITRMTKVCGGIVRVKDNHEASGTVRSFGYDWGQALCREQYGVDPSDWPAEPTDADIVRAQEWENGDWPEWAIKPEEEQA